MPTSGTKPKVFLCSTSYDLEDFRALIVDQLGSEFEFIFFEDAAFPARRGLHSHDQCIAAIAEADIVLCIIDRRYGGTYHGEQPSRYPDQTITVRYKTARGTEKREVVTVPTKELSITWCELMEAYQQSTQVMTFVRQRTWDEKKTRRTNQGLKGFRPAHVENNRVFDLLDWITQRDKDNWITSFSNAVDLLAKVSKWLRSASEAMVVPPPAIKVDAAPPIVVLVEGQRDVDIVQSVITELRLTKPVEFVVANGKRPLIYGLTQYIDAFKNSTGIVVLMDADVDAGSLDPRVIPEMNQRLKDGIGEFGARVKIIQAVPELEEWLIAAQPDAPYPPSMEETRRLRLMVTRGRKPRFRILGANLRLAMDKSDSLREFVVEVQRLDSLDTSKPTVIQGEQ